MNRFVKTSVAAAALAAMLASAMPATPALANGAASTRNLLLLGGAATYLIIQHNHKVHEQRAADAQRAASEAQANDEANTAYHQELTAYNEQAADNAALKKEIAYQHSVIAQQRSQLASLDLNSRFAAKRVVRTAPANGGRIQQVAMTSYGWGTI